MERHDDARAEERRRGEGPASPVQRDEGFETGMDHPDKTVEEEREPNFARGQSEEPELNPEHHGDFARGQEHAPDSRVERRFSEGQEERPTSR
jgi:hypothetical protein